MPARLPSERIATRNPAYPRRAFWAETMLAAAGSTVVPLSLYFLGSRVKVELGLGTGKRQYDKREDLKRREADRATRRAVRRG